MDRIRIFLTVGLALTLLVPPVSGEESPAPPPDAPSIERGKTRPSHGERPRRGPGGEGPRGWEKLDPMERWKELPPERRDAIRREARTQLERIQREVEEWRQLGGLQDLTPPQKNRFRDRYVEERRDLETRLRKQMDEQRKVELPGIMEKLRKEFAVEAE